MPGSPQDDAPIYSDLAQSEPSFAEIVEVFVVGLTERVASMQDALRNEDLATLRQLAHRLKGSGGGHGYPLLTSKAAKLEQLAKHGELDQLRRDLEELQAVVDRVRVVPLPEST